MNIASSQENVHTLMKNTKIMLTEEKYTFSTKPNRRSIQCNNMIRVEQMDLALKYHLH